MATKTITKQFNNLSAEVSMLRSLVISMIGERDSEGEYRPEFVKRVLNSVKNNQSASKFTTKADLLKRIR